MKLSTKTLERLNDISTSDGQASPYRKGYQFVNFFNNFGEVDVYGHPFRLTSRYYPIFTRNGPLRAVR